MLRASGPILKSVVSKPWDWRWKGVRGLDIRRGGELRAAGRTFFMEHFIAADLELVHESGMQPMHMPIRRTTKIYYFSNIIDKALNISN